jgi:hypothetical protein
MTRARFGEGDWFAVPLREGGFAAGVIARRDGSLLLGYFFGPCRRQVPALGDVAGLGPGDAVLAGKFGYLGIREGRWPLLGRLAGWDRRDWPIPVFIRYEELTGRSFWVYYGDVSLAGPVREVQIPPGAAEQGPKDGVMGHLFAEGILTRLLA